MIDWLEAEVVCIEKLSPAFGGPEFVKATLEFRVCGSVVPADDNRRASGEVELYIPARDVQVGQRLVFRESK